MQGPCPCPSPLPFARSANGHGRWGPVAHTRIHRSAHDSQTQAHKEAHTEARGPVHHSIGQPHAHACPIRCVPRTPPPPLHPPISKDSLRVEGVFAMESSNGSPEARLSPSSKTRSLRGGGGPGGSPSYPSGSTSDRVGGGGWPDRGRPAFDWGDREEESRSARPGSTPPSEWFLGRAASTCSAGCAPPPHTFTSCPYRVIRPPFPLMCAACVCLCACACMMCRGGSVGDPRATTGTDIHMPSPVSEHPPDTPATP